MDPIFESSFHRLSKPELIDFGQKTINKIKELETLIEVISNGKHQWEATFDAIADPLMIVSHDFKIRRANLAVAHTAGVPITQVTGRHCYEIFEGRKKTCDGCPLVVSIGEGKGVDEKLGHPIHNQDFHVYAYPIVEANGESDSAVVYYRNVTEEIRLRQELVQQEKMAAIGMLAGGVAHEINNPLGGVLAFTQLLLKKNQDNEMTEDLKEIEHSAVRCRKIVQDLLDFSRLSKEKEKCLVNINDLIEKVMPFVRLEMRSLNVELELQLDKNLPQIMAIPNRLQQVFLNLLTNACHAMQKGGPLKISTGQEPKENKIWIHVQDTGVGIPKEIHEHVFEPFFTTKDPGKGTGLGLAVSYRIVKEHQGDIHFVSQPGKGTTFCVELPMI